MRLFRFLLAALALFTSPVFASEHLTPAQTTRLAAMRVYNPNGPGQIGGGAHALGPGGAASVAYNPLGMVFNQDTFLGVVNGPLGVTNTQQHTLSFWMNGSRSTIASTSYINGTNLGSNPNTQCELSGTGFSPGLCLGFDNSAYGLQLNFDNSAGLTQTTDALTLDGPTTNWLLPFNGSWHHYLISLDTTASNFAVYVDGVKLGFTATRWTNNLYPDFNHAAGWRWGNGSESPNVYWWFSDIYESTQSILCTGVGAPTPGCTGANMIDPATVAKFYNAGPVDFGSTCANPTGRQPEICLTGSGSAMATNKGTATNPTGVRTWRSSSSYIGGLPAASAFTAGVTTTITMGSAAPSGVISGWTVFDATKYANVGAVSSYSGTTLTLQSAAAITSSGTTDALIFYGPQTLPIAPAPYGPAGFTPHRATLRWLAFAAQAAGSSSSYAVSNNGNPIAIGDVLVLIGQWMNSTTTPPTGACPTGWTQAGSASDPTNHVSAVQCWQLQTSAVASNAAASIPNLTASANATRNASWMLLDYAATAGINAVDTAASGCQNNASNTSVPTPSYTTTYANDTLVSVALDDYAGNMTSFGAPSGGAVRFYNQLSLGSGVWWAVADQYLTATGSTSRSWTIAPATTTLSCVIAINPN